MLFVQEVREIATHYNVSPEIALIALETTLNKPELLSAFSANEIVLSESGLRVIRPTGRQDIAVKKKIWRLIKHEFIKTVTRIEIDNNFNYWKRMKQKIVTGEIEKFTPDNGMIVRLAPHSYSLKPIYALCPAQYQATRYRGHTEWLGREKIFFCKDVSLNVSETVMQLNIELSLTSLKIPELVLREKLRNSFESETKVRCRVRYPGKFSLVESTKRISKRLLNEVIDEISEGLRIQVTN